MELEQGIRSQPADNTLLDSENCVQEDVPESDKGQETSLDCQQHLCEEEVHVLYLNVPASDEPQVLDLSSLLVHEGIQVIESSDSTDQISGHIHGAQDIVIENGCAVETSSSLSETQSVQALLGLSKPQTELDQVQVSDILVSHCHSTHVMSQHEQNTSAEALLQLSTDSTTGTYIVDETGTMIPIGQMRSSTLLEVEDGGGVASICQCWCGREFVSQQDLDRHKLAHKYQAQGRITSGLQKCILCLETFVSNKELRSHHAEVHPGGMPWECNICHRTFHKKIAMKAHMRVHNTLTRYQCSSCKKVFFYKTALNRHVKMHSCEKPFKCTICGDMYHSLWDLRKHRLNHQPPKLFACDVCTKVFKQKQTLFVHSRIHTGQKPYSCEVCQRNFSLKSTLVQHRRIHTGEKPNVCHMCQRAFRQNSTLKAHLRTHTNLKPYMCRYCKMRFAYRDEVAEHEHEHAHNKTWQCDECGMWFKNQSLLSRHSRVHTNERPFQCNVCYKSFVQSGSLQSHMRSHTKDKPYQCRICSKAYYTSGTLLVHIRKFHNVDAKSVKEIFPVYSYIEDQKVFTIRNSLLSDLKPVLAEEAHLEDLQSKGHVIVEELVETSGEMLVQDRKTLLERIVSSAEEDMELKSMQVADNSPQHHNNSPQHHNDSPQHQDSLQPHNDSPQLHDSPQHHNDKIVRQEKGKKGAKNSLRSRETRRKTDDGGQDEASQSSHAAHDRQEAALGLAELSLTGGEVMHLDKQPQAKTRTFYREEEEDESDPNITKIILSKEGGIMNSQDPHQCPVCGRIFGRKSIMVEHIRIHTDEKPYGCDFCQASFRQNAQLRSHIRNNHTQVERYQCSFCHKRFLSRGITARHINFHHKLKIKFCQNMDSAWTVDSAVWSDDQFELNPHVLKVGKSKKIDSETDNGPGPAVGDGEQLHQPEEAQHKYMINMSVLPSEGAGHVLTDETHDQLRVEVSAVSRKPTQHSSSSSYCEQPSASSGTEPSRKQDTSAEVSTPACWPQRAPAPDVMSARSEEINRPLKASNRPSRDSVDIKAVIDKDFGSSRLMCGTCAMQFRGISSLRYHLRQVHRKSLNQSDVTYVYQDGSVQNDRGQQMKNEAQIGTSKLRRAEPKLGKTTEGCAEDKSVKIVVYDDSKICVDEPREESRPYVCQMCAQYYSSKVGLEEHAKSHSEEDVESVGLHRCDVCASVMKNTQQVSKHILKFHGVRQIYVCSICQREFFQQSSVYRHMKFLHKWEIKIRGEASIPVFVKPAPLSMHAPSTTSSILKERSEHMRRDVTKLDTCTDDSVAYINLDIRDMDSLQIYKSYQQEVFFQVVSSDDKVKTVNIEGHEFEAVKTEIWEPSQKTVTVSPSVMAESIVSADGEHDTLTSLACLSSEEVQIVPTTTAATLSPSATCNIRSADSFIIVESDKCSQLLISKHTISQLVAAKGCHGNKAGDDVCKVIRVTDVGTDTTTTRQDQNCSSASGGDTASSREAVPLNKSASSRGAVPLNKSASSKGAVPLNKSASSRGDTASFREAVPLNKSASSKGAVPLNKSASSKGDTTSSREAAPLNKSASSKGDTTSSREAAPLNKSASSKGDTTSSREAAPLNKSASSEGDTTSSREAAPLNKSASSKGDTTSSREAAPLNKSASSKEAVPLNKSAYVADASSLNIPIIMSVKDIGATFAGYGQRHQNISDTKVVNKAVRDRSGGQSGTVSSMTAVTSTQSNMTAVTSTQSNMTAVTSTQSNMTAVTSTQSNMTAVASTQSNMTAVASTQSNMTAVTSTQSNMTAVASTQSNMTAVASTQSNMTAVTSTQSNMTAVTSTQSNMTAVASTQSNMTAVTSTQSNMTAVTSTQSNMTAVASTQSNMTAVTSTQSKNVPREIDAGGGCLSMVQLDANNGTVKSSRDSDPHAVLQTSHVAANDSAEIVLTKPRLSQPASLSRLAEAGPDSRAMLSGILPPKVHLKKFDKLTEPELVLRSRSGRPIKRKRFDDEVGEVVAPLRRGRKHL